jgi:hypothetical protein
MILAQKDGLIYEVTKVRVHDQRNLSLTYDLELICGYDYVNPDESDIQGWVSPNNFVEDVQDDTILVYFDESLKDRLIEEGFSIRETLPTNITVKKDI